MWTLIGSELAKLAIKSLSELDGKDASQILRSLRPPKTSLVPGLGALGVGLVIGAGLGVLLAPRAGEATRAALKDKIRDKLNRMNRTRSENIPDVAAASSRETPDGNGSNGGARPS